MKDLFKEVLKLQERLKEELQKIKIEGSAGGGMVKIEMDGEQNVLSVKIDPQVFDERDSNLLEDLLLAAFNDAKKKAQEKAQETLGSLTGLPFRF